ncbi:uncharacterized protein F4817DRAFT_320795 [Daldinia loculata]|uniref:uncharacterized protein n=1 Tax=Daldinia loculata TaxID=103429 RepID=UPI0020C51B28|nr:uncharacterized protein F4817DRAFT_320795 [Daldinia loculata]KAI1642459.1 hypothetical protein F4817DRAFT_320795 [Daldinia loculata]
MPSPSPILVYVIGAGSVFLGIHCFLTPGSRIPPLRLTARTPRTGENTTRVMRTLGALQYHGYDDAVTIMTGVMSLAGLGDGIVVWLYGGDEARGEAFGHWGAFATLAGWSLWRTYGDVRGQ